MNQINAETIKLDFQKSPNAPSWIGTCSGRVRDEDPDFSQTDPSFIYFNWIQFLYQSNLLIINFCNIRMFTINLPDPQPWITLNTNSLSLADVWRRGETEKKNICRIPPPPNQILYHRPAVILCRNSFKFSSPTTFSFGRPPPAIFFWVYSQKDAFLRPFLM